MPGALRSIGETLGSGLTTYEKERRGIEKLWALLFSAVMVGAVQKGENAALLARRIPLKKPQGPFALGRFGSYMAY